jgi:hypothetical protein
VGLLSPRSQVRVRVGVRVRVRVGVRARVGVWVGVGVGVGVGVRVRVRVRARVRVRVGVRVRSPNPNLASSSSSSNLTLALTPTLGLTLTLTLTLTLARYTRRGRPTGYPRVGRPLCWQPLRVGTATYCQRILRSGARRSRQRSSINWSSSGGTAASPTWTCYTRRPRSSTRRLSRVRAAASGVGRATATAATR